MSDDFIVTAFLVFFVAIFTFIFWSAWRAYTPRGFAMWVAMWIFGVLGVISAENATLPSSAPRRQATGIITKIITRGEGRGKTYQVFFKTEDGRYLQFDPAATPLFFAESRDTVRITYLDEKALYPRAIAFLVITGPRAGYSTSVSADWFGPWLGVVFAMILGGAAIIGANNNKRLSKKSTVEVS